MWHWCRRTLLVLCILCPLCGVSVAPAAAQTPDGDPGPAQSTDISRPIPLTNDTIIRMSKAGLEDSIIIQTIATHAGVYYTTPDDLISLKQQGVSQAVIAAMQARGAGLAVRSAAPVTASPAPGADEIGAYYKDKDGQWQPLQTERVEFQSGGWLKSTVTHNIVKQDQNGIVYGAKSQLVLPTGVQILLDTPPGTAPEEYDLIRFRDKAAEREFRVRTGGVFHSTTGSQRDEIEFHATRLGPGIKDLYVFTIPADIEKGEYGVLPPGSSNVPGVSNAGKIFTFSIRE